MTSVLDENIFNIAVEGTFDDCQKIVKELFVDEELQQHTSLTAINSINWARLIAQVVYYFWSYLQINDEEINFIVPLEILKCFFCKRSKKMGLPIQKLHITTNQNDILHSSINKGIMNKNIVTQTYSPSMDIQISSNFERQLFESAKRNSEKIKDMFQEFSDNGSYTIEKDILDDLQSIYSTTAVNDEKTLSTIKLINDKFDYMADPHTATGLSVLLNNDKNETWVSLACAHPAKFGNAIEKAIGKPAVLPKELSKIFDKEEKMMNIIKNDKGNLTSIILSTL